MYATILKYQTSNNLDHDPYHLPKQDVMISSGELENYEIKKTSLKQIIQMNVRVPNQMAQYPIASTVLTLL